MMRSTVITAPFLFDELFALFGERREDHVEFRALDPWYRFYFHTGEQFDYQPSIRAKQKSAAFRRRMLLDINLLQVSKSIFEIGFEKLADKPFTKFTDMLDKSRACFGCKAIIQWPECSKIYKTIVTTGIFNPSLACWGQPIQHNIHLQPDPLFGAPMGCVFCHGRYGKAGGRT